MLVMSTSPGCVCAVTRAPMFTARPLSSSPTVSHSPVCSPARTSRPRSRTDLPIVVAQRIARSARRTRQRAIPECATAAARSRSRCRARCDLVSGERVTRLPTDSLPPGGVRFGRCPRRPRRRPPYRAPRLFMSASSGDIREPWPGRDAYGLTMRSAVGSSGFQARAVRSCPPRSLRTLTSRSCACRASSASSWSL